MNDNGESLSRLERDLLASNRPEYIALHKEREAARTRKPTGLEATVTDLCTQMDAVMTRLSELAAEAAADRARIRADMDAALAQLRATLGEIADARAQLSAAPSRPTSDGVGCNGSGAAGLREEKLREDAADMAMEQRRVRDEMSGEGREEGR